jgi:mono/diheme cytochrome c family protein
MKYTVRLIWVFAVFALLATSCVYQDGERNIEYSPNMYHSIPLEPYSQVVDDWAERLVAARPMDTTIFKNGLAAQKAPNGTVPRAESWYSGEAYMAYHVPNTNDGYELSATAVTSPLTGSWSYNGIPVDGTEADFNRGKASYELFCSVCHGVNGDGAGNLAVKGNKPFEGIVPTYLSAAGTGLKNLSEGKMYHSITYGKGVMGSYASQLTPQQRWEVICYIQHFQRK